jgi:hypothetical protein
MKIANGRPKAISITYGYFRRKNTDAPLKITLKVMPLAIEKSTA